MNTMSASPAEEEAAPAPVLVWDAPVRVFHWLAVLCFGGAWLTAESERWRLVHVTLGWTLAALVVFRLVWGLWGTRHALFANFVRGPRAALAYLRSLAGPRPAAYSGHNPAGALAIVALLALALLVVASGQAAYLGLAGEWLEEAHEVLASAMLLVVGLHLAGVLLSSLLHRQNLVGAMVTGTKRVPAAEGIRHAHAGVAALMLAAVLGFWAWQWQTAPPVDGGGGATATRPHHDDEDD